VLLQRALGGRVARRHGRWDVLEGEDLAPLLLAESHPAALADAEPRPDAEPEAAAGAEHVEDDHQREEGVRAAADGEGGEQTPRAWPRGRIGHGPGSYHRRRARSSRAWVRLRATSLPG